MRHAQASRSSDFLPAVFNVVGGLRSLASQERQDRRQLAALRRGLGSRDGWHPAVAMVIDPLIHEDWDIRPRELSALYQTGALFGSHPYAAEHISPGITFAKTLNSYAQDRARDKKVPIDEIREPLNRQFMAVLDNHRDDLFPKLRHLVALLDGTEIGVDWVRLSQDIARWDDSYQSVQRKWARDWWSAPPKQRGDEATSDQIGTNDSSSG